MTAAKVAQHSMAIANVYIILNYLNAKLLLVIILERSYVTATAFPISLTSVTKDRHDLRDILIKNVCISWKDKLSKSFGAQCVNTKHPQQNIKSAMTSLYKTTLTILHLYSCLNSTTCHGHVRRKCPKITYS